MGRGQCLHVEQFAVGRLLAMKRPAIPGGHPTILNPHVQLRRPLRNPGTGTQQHPQTETPSPITVADCFHEFDGSSNTTSCAWLNRLSHRILACVPSQYGPTDSPAIPKG